MNELAYINKDTQEQINNYLSLKEPPGLILYGLPGLGKSKAARYIAAKLLGCDGTELNRHPDYYEILSEGALRAEHVDLLLDSSHRCSIGIRKVFVVYNAHTITRMIQNRLLKLLEDRGKKNILILISSGNMFLDTIRSRCNTISFHPLNHVDMDHFLGMKEIPENSWQFIHFLTDNAPYIIENEYANLQIYLKKYNQMQSISMREDLYKIFHVLVEKDPNEFFSANTKHPEWNIHLVLFPFYEMMMNEFKSGENSGNLRTAFPYSLYEIEQAFCILEEGRKHLTFTSYTKNDFFNLLRFIVEAV
ncbi:MAG: hypothetical protein PHW34_09120 [Hespellia sp.]|nr:hypothetical protein [Hespellia sp.]